MNKKNPDPSPVKDPAGMLLQLQHHAFQSKPQNCTDDPELVTGERFIFNKNYKIVASEETILEQQILQFVAPAHTGLYSSDHTYVPWYVRPKLMLCYE